MGRWLVAGFAAPAWTWRAAVKRVDFDIARSQVQARARGSGLCHRHTLGWASPGAYRVHSAFAGGPASAHSAAYGSVNSGIGHVRTVPSASAVARSLPSGLNATPVTLPPEPVPAGREAPAACQVAVFHSRTSPSLYAAAMSLPSGLNATAFTLPPASAPLREPTASP